MKKLLLAPLAFLLTAAEPAPAAPLTPVGQQRCHASYPDVCIPPPPPDLDCPDIPFRRFRVVGSDPHRFDRDRDGIGCESN
jgi:micrococcal nuclease